MEESQCALETFIDEMGNNVLELLCSLDWCETGIQTIVTLLLLALLWLKVGIDTHETCDSSNVIVSKGL